MDVILGVLCWVAVVICGLVVLYVALRLGAVAVLRSFFEQRELHKQKQQCRRED